VSPSGDLGEVPAGGADGGGVLYDPFEDAAFARALLAEIAAGSRHRGQAHEIVGWTDAGFAELSGGSGGGEGAGGEASGGKASGATGGEASGGAAGAPEAWAALEPRPLGAEQSNTSLRYGDRLVLKLFRKLEPGVNPDLEIG